MRFNVVLVFFLMVVILTALLLFLLLKYKYGLNAFSICKLPGVTGRFAIAIIPLLLQKPKRWFARIAVSKGRNALIPKLS
ncbi:hypothetical protein GGTG_11535 [Gaeumannomyces tritici R3-111a-1]|uniref:Uncharacterized protein n=1 Tax=Gaeumannomyces tritici (strain R3-111a-1) TaxID=644352 RepID=J3PDG4_GAET3|nr:hypothetical protein GGTG_11535 [Gaeumannomyces tritici R3-111a-1]EJT70512.1 hypothetical protein GGTG_11535 [Gaeumannomyces tritici R3-111a-1]